MKESIALLIKGMAMGAANVVPGVSGGTIALITGIFERLIHAIKSFNMGALKLLFAGQWKALVKHTDLGFLVAVFAGVAISILSIARLFDFLFENYPVYIWSFFFGLIVASVFFVGKTVKKWTVTALVIFFLGAALALSISLLTPATENSSFLYLFLCGVVAACSMILPGLSGSFVLILMGNYQLVMIEAVTQLNVAILLPVIIGAGVGLIGFSHLLAWVFKRYHDQTIAILSGFILGSLGILWPWKQELYKLDSAGGPLLKKNGELIVEGYEWLIPDSFSVEVVTAIGFILLGIATIWLLEKVAAMKG